MSQEHDANESAARIDEEAGLPGDAAPGPPELAEDAALAAGRRRFSRRLATFGLGEAQQPLLTDTISSFDAEGNPR